jgi:adenylate kinase family enzyme
MKKIVLIIGNSSSGKSTMAKDLSSLDSLTHLDLDTVAWLSSSPPTRKEKSESMALIDSFIQSHQRSVIEGCYGDLIEMVLPYADELIFLDTSKERCIQNAKSRPFEPHKYATKEAQDINLDMLIEWISSYETREDSLSKKYHERVFNEYSGVKRRIKTEVKIKNTIL